jgi:lipid-binding SYLF domain-containing protein
MDDTGRAARGRGVTRRGLLATAGAALLAGCGNGVGSPGASVIDQRVDRTLAFMEGSFPAAVDLRGKSAGMLVMPLVTEAAVVAGGSYGRGALVIDGVNVDYYSAHQASVGLQLGAQQYAHVLFFLTPGALQGFRTSPGWTAGADLEYVWDDRGVSAGADTTTVFAPVVATVFGQSGALVAASVEGTKYSRIIP